VIQTTPDFFISLIGLLAGILTTGSQVPQALQVYRTGRTEDLNSWFTVMLFSGTIIWLMYGLMINSMPLVLFNAISGCLTGFICIEKLGGG
jgi:MtN3 and saliva related transmembrane protein